MTPTTLETLFRMRREDITLGGDLYALNVRLGLKPWMPPSVEVWLLHDDCLDYEDAERWAEVWRILETLYKEHQRRVEGD